MSLPRQRHREDVINQSSETIVSVGKSNTVTLLW